MAKDWGMYGLGLSDAQVQETVRESLEKRLEYAVGLLKEKEAALRAAAMELTEKGSLSAERLEEIIEEKEKD